jgi:hypothetical protein
LPHGNERKMKKMKGMKKMKEMKENEGQISAHQIQE